MKEETIELPRPGHGWEHTEANVQRYRRAYARQLKKLRGMSESDQADLLNRLTPGHPDYSSKFRWRFLSPLLPSFNWTPEQQAKGEANLQWFGEMKGDD